MNHHEAAAADISGARIGHGHRKAGSDRGIDRIAALSQEVGADLRREFFLRDHHAVLGGNGMNGTAGLAARRSAACSCATAGGDAGKHQHECRNYSAPSG